MAKHAIVLIHGISDGKPTDDFDKFWAGVSDAYFKRTKTKLDSKYEPIPIKWDVATNTGEKNIFEMSFSPTKPTDDDLVRGNLLETTKSLLDTRAWRYFSTYLAGDVIAYIDESDNQIRSTTWSELKKGLTNPDGTIKQFSVVGHSLGSVIAYDFVYSMIQNSKLFSFTDSDKETFDAGKWQSSFADLYTMGSPIGLFLMRKKQFWENKFSGLKNPMTKVPSKTRQWINIWDKDDLIAYPLQNIFSNVPNLVDVEVDAGMLMPWAHTQYWSDRRTAEVVAKSLK